MTKIKYFFVPLAVLGMILPIYLFLQRANVFIIFLPYIASALIIGTWIFFDSKKIFKSTTNEALNDAGFTYHVGNLWCLLTYLKIRTSFLADETYRKKFLAERERARAPLSKSARIKVIRFLSVGILLLYSFIAYAYFSDNLWLLSIFEERQHGF